MTEEKALVVADQPKLDTATLEKAAHMMTTGDISRMTMIQKADFLASLAKAYGLSPFPPPFTIIRTKEGKEMIYANKSCADQLRKLYGISVEITYAGPLMLGDGVADNNVYIVKAKAKANDGREDEEMGSIWLGNIQGEDRANAILKAVTKAKRRVTYSICGLSFLDETEMGFAQRQQATAPRQIVPQLTAPTVSSTLPTVEAQFTVVEAPKQASNEPLPPVAAPLK